MRVPRRCAGTLSCGGRLHWGRQHTHLHARAPGPAAQLPACSHVARGGRSECARQRRRIAAPRQQQQTLAPVAPQSAPHSRRAHKRAATRPQPLPTARLAGWLQAQRLPQPEWRPARWLLGGGPAAAVPLLLLLLLHVNAQRHGRPQHTCATLCTAAPRPSRAHTHVRAQCASAMRPPQTPPAACMQDAASARLQAQRLPPA